MTEYERLRAALDKKLAADPSLRAVVKRIKNGTATLADSAEYARVLSHILGREVSASVLDLDDRAGVVTQLLRDCYGDVNSIYAQTQTLLDEQAGIHIRPQQPDFPAERVDQFTHSLIDPTVAESVIKRRARAGCETITKSYHDDCIKKNAQFRHDAGLKCYIVRIGTKCCEWCSDVAGKYEFGDQPDGIFRRHDNCDCTIIYDGQVLRGKQNADGSRSKTWEELPNANAADYTAPSLSEEQGRAIEQRNLAQIRGLTNGTDSGKIKAEEKKLQDSFIKAETIDKAKEYAKDVLGFEYQQYDKFHLDVANMVNYETARIYDVFGNLHESGFLDGIMYYPKKTEWVAAYSPSFHTVYMKNVSAKNSLKKMAEEAEIQFNAGFWSDSSPEHTIRHELGHSVQHFLTDNNSDKLNRISEIRKKVMESCEIKEWSIEDSPENMKKAGKIISYYALRNDGEFIAESVAEYMNGNPRETAKSVIDILLERV